LNESDLNVERLVANFVQVEKVVGYWIRSTPDLFRLIVEFASQVPSVNIPKKKRERERENENQNDSSLNN
jgi:hypothetical protein